ncbi:DUF429 domain-containing protein [Naasia aerilata]|uniref:DUF429 domain-containing protein n=1 Tax=Naasia aerilata TaxID=1162966 RepID=A0ABN6XV25_9MICO|nr:DUF429 domain-containing protein [Naasia aerilata]BDZ47228.1 hypothetical protein GCM10025866_31370 [Naasia aerilata]
MQYIGIDLAWSEGSAGKLANESGYALLDERGVIRDAGWVRGIDAVVEWLEATAAPGAVIAVDAPLVVANAEGMRESEREVARRYGRWQVYANASNTSVAWMGGVTLRRRLEHLGYTYLDGSAPASADARSFFECYPYTTIVGMEELGYERERPRYKRLDKSLTAAEGRARRAVEFDELLRRVGALTDAEPPVDLRSHPLTARLLDEPSTAQAAVHKHREDLLDAVLCAWTAAIWHVHGDSRTQVLGATDALDEDGRRPTIIAPARPEQRREAPASPSNVSILHPPAIRSIGSAAFRDAADAHPAGKGRVWAAAEPSADLTVGLVDLTTEGLRSRVDADADLRRALTALRSEVDRLLGW